MTTDKERTARIQIYRKIKKIQVFTLETSFFGYEETNGKKYRWTIEDLMKIGQGAMDSVLFYLTKKKELTVIEK